MLTTQQGLRTVKDDHSKEYKALASPIKLILQPYPKLISYVYEVHDTCPYHRFF